MDLIKKKVTILGGKRSGEALARLVVQLNGQAKISENGQEAGFSPGFREWAKNNDVLLEFNGHTQEFIEDSDYLVLSPGVRIDSECVQWAKKKNILVLGEIEFAFQSCDKPVVAVTGSNGKTTVVTLINKIINEAGFKSCLCGNVGFPFSDHVLDNGYDYFVLEVSSFQLESLTAIESRPADIKGFKPKVAVILNFSQNHLDRHKDMREYLESKKRIFLNQDNNDFAVLNHRDDYSKNIAIGVRSEIVYFNADNTNVNPNYLAVVEVAKLLGIKEEICKKVFKDFKGVEHRMEHVREMGGVKYVNDSKSTTVEATKWALSNSNMPVLLICGGRDKNLDYSVIKVLVKDRVKKVFVIGETQEKIADAYMEVIEVIKCVSLKEAILKAKGSSIPGDIIMLSPMCASFDMFDNFEHRGRVFKEIVNSL